VLRRLRGVLLLLWSGLRHRSNLTLVTVDRWTLAEELWSFGEDALHLRPLEMSDDELIRVWVLAGRLYTRGAGRSSGEAAALAAVAVLEHRPRSLARSRRRPQSQRPHFGKSREERQSDVLRIEESTSFPAVWR
jgi:hypothetical protein